MSLILDHKLVINKDVMESPNLCDRFTDDDLVKIGSLVKEGYDRDKQSRTAWERRMQAALDMAMQIQIEKTFPWPKASNVIFPLITIAALQFSARSYTNIIQGTDVVKYRVVGEDKDGSVNQRADRISKHMSWQVLEEDMAWEEMHDRLLINLAIVGTNFIKTSFSSRLGHNISELVGAQDLVLDYYAKSVESCARKTQNFTLYRNEIYERVKSELYCPILDEDWFKAPPPMPEVEAKLDNRKGISSPQSDQDTPFAIHEQHRLLDLDGDGYAEPYIVTVESTSGEVLRMVSRFDREEDVERNSSKEIIRITPTEYFTKYSFIPSPDGGIYDVGFGVLLGPLNESVNTGINQMLDAGTMLNSNGGFLAKGAKIRGGTFSFAPWEWKRVESTGDDLRKNLVPFPTREPSNVMFQLVSLLINYTDRVAGTVDQMVGENPGQNTPAETSRNMTEQGMQVYSMIFKRVWRSMKEEFKKLHKLNRDFLPPVQHFGAANDKVTREDYKSSADLVVPVADPTVTSNAMRMQQALLVSQRAQGIPGYSIPDTEKNLLRAARVDAIDKLYPGPDKVPPLTNPKVQVEQLKLQAKKMQLDYEREQFRTQLMEDRRKINAEIAKLEAESISLVAGIQGDEAARQVQRFDSVINAMKAYSEALNSRIESMKGDDDGSKSDGGGAPGAGAAGPGGAQVPGMEIPGNQPGGVSASPAMA